MVGVLCLALYKISRPPFFVTESPDSTYTVNLFGQKERPAFFTVEVGVTVLKDKTPFLPYQTLHSGDFMDLSFELGYPDSRWVGDNVLQFYNEENFDNGKSQVIFLSNNSNKTIKHLRLGSWDWFLLFDVLPGAHVRLSASPTKGDDAWVYLEGEFYDGQTFKKSATYNVTGISKLPVFTISVAEEDVKIESSYTYVP